MMSAKAWGYIASVQLLIRRLAGPSDDLEEAPDNVHD